MDLPDGDGHCARRLAHVCHTQAAVHALRHPPLILIIRFARTSKARPGPPRITHHMDGYP